MKAGAFQAFHRDVLLTPPPVIHITVKVQAHTCPSLLSIVRPM